MEDNQSNKETNKGISRRGFLGASAASVAGVAGLGLTGVMTPAEFAEAASKARNEAHHNIGPGELDEYYGFWLHCEIPYRFFRFEISFYLKPSKQY